MGCWPPLFVFVPLAHLAVVTAPLAVIDARTLRLPNALVVPGLAVSGWALLWAAFADPGAAVSGGTGAVGVGGSLLGGWMLGAVGMGDVKLGVWLGGVAGVTGVLAQPEALAAGLLVAAGMAGAVLLAEIAAAGGCGAVGTLRLPFGPSLLAGFWATVLQAAVSPG